MLIDLFFCPLYRSFGHQYQVSTCDENCALFPASMINHHTRFLRIATDSSIRNSSTFMFYRMKYYETFFLEKTRKRNSRWIQFDFSISPLLSIATIGSLIRQPNIYKMGLAPLLVNTVLSTRWWCTQSKINLDIWVKEWCITSLDIEAVIDQS